MTVPRPRLTEWSTAPHQFESTVHRFSDKSYRNNDDNGSDDSGSFKSHMTEERHRSESTPAAISPSGVQNLRQLMHRQRDLASHELTSVMSLSDHSEKFPFTSSYKMPDLIPQVSPSAAVFTAKPKAPIPVAKSLSDSSASVTLERHNGFSPTVHNGYNGHSNNNNQVSFLVWHRVVQILVFQELFIWEDWWCDVFSCHLIFLCSHPFTIFPNCDWQ